MERPDVVADELLQLVHAPNLICSFELVPHSHVHCTMQIGGQQQQQQQSKAKL
jgi:hypothetical protein